MPDSKERAAVTILIPLPLYYPPPDAKVCIPEEEYKKTGDEVARATEEGGTIYRFPAGKPEGFWWDKGYVEWDTLALLEFDMEDTEENRAWVRKYVRDVLLKRFRQKAIYIRFVWPMWRLVVGGEEILE